MNAPPSAPGDADGSAAPAPKDRFAVVLLGGALLLVLIVAAATVAGAAAAGLPGAVFAGAFALVAPPVVARTWIRLAVVAKAGGMAGTFDDVMDLDDRGESPRLRLVPARPRRAPGSGRRAIPHPETVRPVVHLPHTTGPASRPDEEDLPEPSFWHSLRADERRELAALAEPASYPAGAVLCREGGPADDIMVVLSGSAKVSVKDGDGEHIIAVRGPGDLIGERAALLVKVRSATVTAVNDVEAHSVPTAAFRRFLDTHPRVHGVLERQVYGRLTEVPALRPAADARPAWSGGHCTIFYADVTGFSSPVRDDDDRKIVRAAMYELLDEAFGAAGLRLDDLYHEDRGDGVLVILPPGTPAKAAVDPTLACLASGLRRHNHRYGEAARIRLRVALHVGTVERDDHGVCGKAIITAARLLDAPALKLRIEEESADLGVIVSGFVFEDVIEQGPGFVDPRQYTQVQVEVKEASLLGWIHVAGGSTMLRAV